LESLLVPGKPILTPIYDTPEEFFVDYENYWKTPVKPHNFDDFSNMYSAAENGPAGLWEVIQWDPKTGRAKRRTWSNRILTDNGAIQILTAAINNAVPAAVFNNIYINNNDGSTTLTTALTNGQTGVTSLAVAALPAAIPANYPSPANANSSQVQIGYGTGQTQTVTLSGAASQAATSISTSSFTSNAAYAIGTAVVPVPNIQENPSNANLKANQSSVLEQYSGNLSAGAFTATQTTGAGNRSMQVVFVFKNSTNGGSTSNGNYTTFWLVNVSSAAAANNYVDHLINVPVRCDNNNNISASCLIKL
jgi:hypothetical protein